MGGCQGARKTYTERTQKLCRAFEDGFKLHTKDWKIMVAFVRSYAQPEGNVPAENLAKAMEDAGLKDVYSSHDTKLREILQAFVGEQTPQYEPIVYFMMFMCGGKETEKAAYLCQMLNGMDQTKTTVPCEKLAGVLESLLRLSILTIPENVGTDKIAEYEAMKTLDTATMVKEWCPDCVGETVTVQKLTDWVAKRRAFTSGEARALAIEKLQPVKAKEQPKATVEETMQKTEKVSTE